MNKIKLDDQSRFDKISFCFKKCVNSFEEKALSPYERECFYPCLENQIALAVELHNSQTLFNQKKQIINQDHTLEQLNYQINFGALIMLKIFFTFLNIITAIQSQYIYSHLQENVYFSPTTAERRVEMNLGNFDHLKQYTLWGWYKFGGEVSAISNILTLRNIQPFGTEDPSIGPYPNPQFQVCPVTDQEILLNPTLLNQPGIKDNPNCFTQQKNIKAKGPDYLYINYDLNPIQNNTQTYSVVFLLQSGLAQSGNSDMKIEGFLDIPFKINVWSFFAISLNYTSQQVSLLLNIFDGIPGNKRKKNFTVDFPDFKLQKFGQLVFAGVENNPYFQSTSGFIGNIAYINMGMFYTDNLDSLWLNFMDIRSYSYRGLLIDFVFANIENNNEIESIGQRKDKFQIKGSNSNLYLIDKNSVGIRYYPGSYVDLGFVDFKFGHEIKSISFYFQFIYKENLKNFHILIQRGTEDTNGYLQIILEKSDQNRLLKLALKGASQKFTWQSKSVFKQNIKYWVQIGISISPALNIQMAYLDSLGNSDFSSLGENFKFDTSPQKIVLQNQANQISSDGYFDLQRFSISNTNSGAVYTALIQQSVSENIADINKYCALRSSGFFQSFGCQYCPDKVLNLNNYNCVDYCPSEHKNALSQICVKCSQKNCQEIDLTQFNIQQSSSLEYVIKSSRSLLNEQIDFENMISVKIDDLPPSANSFQYKIEQDQNIKPQQIKLKLDLKKPVMEKTLGVDFVQDPNKPLYDVNRNQLQVQKPKLFIKRICYIENWKKFILRIIAWLVLGVFFLSFLILILITIIRKKFVDLSTLWKQFFTNFLLFQIMIFFLFIGINMPCCVEYVLNLWYEILFSWSHSLGKLFDSMLDSDTDYQKGFIDTILPIQFQQTGIKSSMLHNMAIIFIVHIFIFLLYLIFKIWDLIVKQSNNCVYKTFVFLEYTFIIIGFFTLQIPIQIYTFLNIQYRYFSHPYFILSFVLSIIYLLVYVILFFFFLQKLTKNTDYFQNAQNYNKLYFFFAGRKISKSGRLYDLIFSFILFFYCIILVFLNSHQVLQSVFIILSIFVLLIITLVCNPFKYTWQFVSTFLGLVFLVITCLLFVIIAIYDAKNCKDCGGRESTMCFLILIPLIIGFFCLFVPFIMYTFYMGLAPKKFQQKKKKLNAKNLILDQQINQQIDIEKPDSSRTLIRDVNQANQLNQDCSQSVFMNDQSNSISLHQIGKNNLLSNQTLIKVNKNKNIQNIDTSIYNKNFNQKQIELIQNNKNIKRENYQNQQALEIEDFVQVEEQNLSQNVFNNQQAYPMIQDQDITLNKTIQENYNYDKHNQKKIDVQFNKFEIENKNKQLNFYDIVKKQKNDQPVPLKEDTCEYLNSEDILENSSQEENNKKYLQQVSTFINKKKQQFFDDQNKEKIKQQNFNFKKQEIITAQNIQENYQNDIVDSNFMKSYDNDDYPHFK